MSDNITREPYRNAWYKQLSDAVKKHDEEIAEMVPHLVPDVEEGDNGKILIAGEDGAFDWGQPPEELPIITESDEGKVLKVEEGVPKWLEDSDSEYLLVTVTRSGEGTEQSPYVYTADKTYAEILPYAQNGKCCAFYNNAIHRITNIIPNTGIIFINEYAYTNNASKLETTQDDINRSLLTNIIKTSITFMANGTISVATWQVDSLVQRRLTVTNNQTLSEADYKSVILTQGAFTIGYIKDNKYYYLHRDNGTPTSQNNEFDFVNYEVGIKAHIDANRLVTITQIPKLPTATSADEGKVVMVDSNGDYVLGVASAGYVIPFALDTAFQSDNMEVNNND